MNTFQSCSNTRDAVNLYRPFGLYLKPIAALHISVQLPQLKALGKAISNTEIIEKLKQWALPEVFTSLKVSKNTLEFVRFDAEIENVSDLPSVLARLDKRTIKISGFKEQLKVRASEAKPVFPSRHDWDKFFRDAKNMDGMKPGERPDTMYISNLPCRWFSSFGHDKPDSRIFRKIFEQFGEIKYFDIPRLDSSRSQMESHLSGIKIFPSNPNVFEAYIQFKEYHCFAKAMDAFRGKKLLHIDEHHKAVTTSIKVDFDKTKHLSEESIRRRKLFRERIIAKENEKRDMERKKEEHEQDMKDREIKCKMERRKLREQIRKEKQLKILQQKEAEELNKKIATEERLLLLAQRKLESIRLLSELVTRVKSDKLKNTDTKKSSTQEKKDSDIKKGIGLTLGKDEDTVRNKLIQKFKKRREERERLKIAKGLSKKSESIGNLSDADMYETAYEDFDDNVNVNYNSGSDFRADYSDNLNDMPQKYERKGFGYGGYRGRRPWRNYRGGRNDWHNNDYYNNQNRGRRNFRGRWGGYGVRSRFHHKWTDYQQDDFASYEEEDDELYLTYVNDYHKYYQSLDRKDSFSSRSYSRERWSYSGSSPTYSRSRSRSYSRSYSRSRSRSWTRSRSRSYSGSHVKSKNKKPRKNYSKSRSHSRGSDKRDKEKSLKSKADDSKPVTSDGEGSASGKRKHKHKKTKTAKRKRSKEKETK